MERSLSLIFAGDACMANIQEKLDASYARWALEKVQPILDGADFRLINLENPLTDCEDIIYKSGPNHKGIPKNIALLTEGRFDCAILANNHTGDFGEQGALDTINLLAQNNIAQVGAGRNTQEAYRPWIAKKSGKAVAVIAVCENEFGTAGEAKAGAAGFESERLRHTIQEAKAAADWAVVVFHGGNEHNPLPSPRVKERYRMLADWGADAIIGMHPHCPQGVEIYHGIPIAYSVGNFFFRARVPDTAYGWYFGYLPKLTFSEGKAVEMEIIPYHFIASNGQVLPLAGAEKDKFMEHLTTISAMFGDEKEHRRWFDAWCTMAGVDYLQHLHYDAAFLGDEQQRKEHDFAPVRNLFTCEAHNELLTNTLRLLEDDRLAQAKEDAEILKKLQYIHID